MSALNQKLFRDIVRLKGQVLTIALVVAAGIASYVTMRTTWSSLMTSKTVYYERYRMADVFARLKRAPSSVARQIENIPGVAVAYPRIVREVMIPIEGLPEPASATLVSTPSHRDAPLNGVYLRSGRMPAAEHADEVVVVDSFANAHGLHLGDHVPAVINGARRDLNVVGIGLAPEFVFIATITDFMPDDKRRAVMWMNRAQLAPAFEMEGAFNDIVLRLQPGASKEEVLRQLDALLEPYGGFGAVARDKQPSNFILEGELTQLRTFANVFPILFLSVAAFLLNIVLSRLVNLQQQQIAVLKAVGYPNRAIAVHYLKLVALIATLGALIGVAVGAWFGSGLTALYAELFRFPTLVYRLDISVAATAVLISVFAAVAGALGAVRRAVKLPPAEAMRPPAPARYRASLIDRMGLSKVLGQSGMMVVREVARRPLRMVLSSLGIAAAVGVLIVGRFGYDSFDFLLHTVFHEEQRGDITVALIAPAPDRAVREIMHVPGVLDAEGIRAVPVRIRAEHLYRDTVILGIPASSRLRRIVDRDAHAVALPDHGLAISRKLGEILGAGVGDDLDVEIREGNRGTTSVPVAMLVDDGFGLQGYMQRDVLHRVLGEEPVVSTLYLRIDPSRLRDVHRRLKQMPMVAGVTDKQSMIDRFDAQTGDMMLTMSLVMTVFACTVAIGVVYNNARVVLSMRSRDLASLRVLGFTRGEISAVLLGELGAQIIVAIPLGLVLGTWWAHVVMASVDPEVYRMPIIVSPQSYAFAVVVTAAAGIVSALLVRRKLDKLDLISVLKARE